MNYTYVSNRLLKNLYTTWLQNKKDDSPNWWFIWRYRSTFLLESRGMSFSWVLSNFVLISYFCFLCREGRYLLIMTENFAALPRVKQILLEEDCEEPYVIFGSGFPKDQLFTQVKCCFVVLCYYNVCLCISLSLRMSVCLYFGDTFFYL